MHVHDFAKKIFTAWLTLFFFASPLLGARVAYAQGVPVFDPSALGRWLKDQVRTFITDTMQAAVVTALVNTMTFAADRLAYDAAVRIATGGPAEDPLFDGSPSTTYLGDFAADIAGEAIGSLSETIEGAGGLLSNFDLCAPSTPYILLQIKLGIQGVFDRPEPKCDFNKMFGPEGTWAAFIAELSGEDGEKSQIILKELANMYDPQKEEFGASLGVFTDIFGETTFLPLIGVQEHIVNNGFKPYVDFITGNVQTPADILQDEVERANKEGDEVRKQATFAMLEDKNLVLQMGIHAGSVFTNTLLSKIQERIWEGMFDFDVTQIDPFDVDSFALETTEDIAERYKTLLTAAPFQISNYSILSEFITCPGDGTRGLYNCVADSNFVSAIARAEAGAPLTIEEAIEEGLVNGSWPLISASDVARNQDAFCYSYGFCYGNLVKLRKARVISLGWELAANASANSVENPVTLQEVIDGFTSCGPDGLPDDNHPWCKMIDPNWVLKYPETQCRMYAYGETLLTSDSDERGQSCVDMPSCISEDEDGNCVGGYGYCVAEENTWRFRGESCPEYAASCLVFEDTEGQSTALLRNTVDPGPCTAENGGCRWFATRKEQQDDGTFMFAAVEDIAASDAQGGVYASRIYLNGNRETCSEENGGCTELVKRTEEVYINTVYNPSFEIDDNTDGMPDGWLTYHLGGLSWPPEVSTDGAYAREGDWAISPGQASTGLGAVYQPGLELGQARTYTLSFYARQRAEGETDTVTALLDLTNEEGVPVDIDGLAISGDCDDAYTSILGTVVTTGVGIEAMQPSSSSYERFSCTFTVPPLSDSSLRIFGDLFFLNFDGYIDSVQLEQGEDASLPVVGYSTSERETVVAKVAPEYLGCTGEESDPEECGGYARVCAETDQGCTLYTPTNGDPDISGIATESDVCPAECAGYDTYRQEATYYEPDGVDTVYLIPDTATSCAAESVGCDEFTNLATEEREYFTFLRACVTEEQAAANSSSDNQATFYTWEGSDESGYQLRTWSLLESNAGTSDYTHVGNADGTSGATDRAPDQAPCSTWTANAEGISCADASDEDGDGFYDWDTEECNEREDIFTNSDCREFYDENGNIHYRQWQNTVTVNASCETYRKTTIVGDDEADREAVCEDAGGYFVGDSGDCRFYGYKEESTLCDESQNGCRAYAGGRSRNSRLVFEDIFEEGTLNNWDAASAAYATYSNESLAADGHSMLITGPVTTFIAGNGSVCEDEDGCEGTAQSFGGECTIAQGATYCGTLENELFVGKTYTISIVAKGTDALELGFDSDADPDSLEVDIAFDSAIDLEDGWQQFTFGPVFIDEQEYPDFGEGTTLVMIPSGSAYIDNVVLREGEEDINLIRDSWTIPAVCDESPTGSQSPQYYLGCEEYTDHEGETAYLKSLSALCSEEDVGCDAFFKTQESESAFAKTRNATCSNTDGSDADSDPDVATSATACYYFSGSSGFDTDSPYLCTIAVGESSCLFSEEGFTPDWLLPSHISYGPETVVTPADSDVFLVVTDEVECDEGAAGCTEFGEPLWSQDRNSTSGAESVYLMNLPDTYDEILCTHEELFCDAFTTNAAETFYFKHPLEQTCEYMSDITVGGTVYTGWFRSGTTDFCYGTCEDGSGNEGDACGSGADCASDETCNAENPSYVIGGTASGIWRNGDEAYRGWAGTCSAAYDTCTEFQDKLAQDDGELYGATNGTSHFYLNNDSLSEYSLADSQKCDGKVSLKNGCAMFYDTGTTSLSANASATEITSRHANTIFGTEPYGLVDPINCEDGSDTTVTTAEGEEIDLCARRCTYDVGEMNDLTDGTTYKEKLDEERTGSVAYDRDDIYVFGGSCFDSTDCAQIQGESGAFIDAVACATQVRVDPFSASASFNGAFNTWSSQATVAGFEKVPRQENDVNTVLKVNPNRECAEWLACSDTITQWNETTASFVTTCNDIELCKKYDAATGSTFCADWDFSKPEVIYDAEWYAGRDTSWYGNEYAGMAIPNLFPVQALTQANVSQELYCVNTVTKSLGSGTCEQEWDSCGGAAVQCMTYENAVDAGALTESDGYALVLNAGSCSEDYGDACAVGFCEETGAACATNDECTAGACIVGACYNFAEDTSDADNDGNTGESAPCQTAEDCQEGQVCQGGACADVGDDVEAEDYDAETGEADSCTPAETFIAAAELKIGSCINDACLLTPSGDAYESGQTESKVCRAYPENNSPFPNEIVESWYDPAVAGTIADDPDQSALPYDMRSGFENVVTCAYGEECDCSYKKVTYGEGQQTRYYAQAWGGDFSVCGGDLETYTDAGTVCTSASACSSGTCTNVTGQLGVCQSGDRMGGYCTEDEQCGGESGEHDCAKATGEDVMYGLNGFCLERDTSLNILGDRSKQACISWLPVDQLAGDTDLRAKYVEAGYFEDTYACTNVDFYVDVGTSAIPAEDGSYGDGDIACAESDVGVSVSSEESYAPDTIRNCAFSSHCPEGYWTMIGQVVWSSDDTEYMAHACKGDAEAEVNDCPYVCVPYGAYTEGQSCDPEGDYVASVLEEIGGTGWDYEDEYSLDGYDEETLSEGGYYAIGKKPTASDDFEGFQEFDTMATALSGCRVPGVEYTDTIAADIFGINAGGDGYSWRYLTFSTDKSFENPACKDVLKVSDSAEYASFAYTDRLLNENGDFAIEDGSYTNMQYSLQTNPTPFGFITTNPALREVSDTPLQVAACVDEEGVNLVPPNGADHLNACEDGMTEYTDYENATAPSSALARAFIDFELNKGSMLTGYEEDLWSVSPSSGATDSAFGRINQLFAATDLGIDEALFTWGGAWTEEEGFSVDQYTAGGITEAYATYDVRAEEGNPPTVWSVNVTSCTDDGILCEEGAENRITINSQDTGDQSGAEFFSATMKFYAAADKNQLPIRRIIVDWGDDTAGGSFSGSDADDNFYKNSRGLQEGTETSKCELDSEWGLTSDSCDPYYYNFNHIYTCSSEILSDETLACADSTTDGDTEYDSFPCWIDDSGDGVADSCVFKPRVHVRDNWGWCTGTCTTGSEQDDDNPGCFDSGSLAYPEAESIDECDYQSSSLDPFIEYEGMIIVTP